MLEVDGTHVGGVRLTGVAWEEERMWLWNEAFDDDEPQAISRLPRELGKSRE